MTDDVVFEADDAPNGPIELPTNVSSFADGYWNVITQYLREEGYIDEDDFLVSAEVSVTVEDAVEITDFETVSP